MAIALRKHSTLVNDNAPPSRDQSACRYRALREISKRHHPRIPEAHIGRCASASARRLGLAQGKTLILDDMDELNYVYDLAISHGFAGAFAGDRPLRQVGPRLRRGSEWKLFVPRGGCARGKFSILLIGAAPRNGRADRHPTLSAGLRDMLVDIGWKAP